MTLEELSALDPNLLAAALHSAQKREREQKLKTLPTCRCGALATQVCTMTIIYRHADLHVDVENATARVGSFDDFGDVCPGDPNSAPDDGEVWVCCDSDACFQDAWKSMRAYEFSLAVRGF